jgi:hypothetical protein
VKILFECHLRASRKTAAIWLRGQFEVPTVERVGVQVNVKYLKFVPIHRRKKHQLVLFKEIVARVHRLPSEAAAHRNEVPVAAGVVIRDVGAVQAILQLRVGKEFVDQDVSKAGNGALVAECASALADRTGVTNDDSLSRRAVRRLPSAAEVHHFVDGVRQNISGELQETQSVSQLPFLLLSLLLQSPFKLSLNFVVSVRQKK